MVGCEGAVVFVVRDAGVFAEAFAKPRLLLQRVGELLLVNATALVDVDLAEEGEDVLDLELSLSVLRGERREDFLARFLPRLLRDRLLRDDLGF